MHWRHLKKQTRIATHSPYALSLILFPQLLASLNHQSHSASWISTRLILSLSDLICSNSRFSDGWRLPRSYFSWGSPTLSPFPMCTRAGSLTGLADKTSHLACSTSKMPVHLKFQTIGSNLMQMAVNQKFLEFVLLSELRHRRTAPWLQSCRQDGSALLNSIILYKIHMWFVAFQMRTLARQQS